MSDSTYDVAQYAHDLRQITSEETDHKKIVQRIRPLAQKLAATPGWLENAHRTCTSERGFGVHLLHEEDDHSNAVFLIAWLPDRGTLPHNHKTWAVVAGVEGEEQEIMFSRVDDGSKNGYAKLERSTDTIVTAGDVTCLLGEDIHSVWNVGEEMSLSLHTYGRHINHTGRSEFDTDNDKELPYIVEIE